MHEIQNNWQRIESVIKWANMTTNFFARYIGLPRGENLYQIKRGNNGISRDVAERIVTRFPEIDLLWLLTGRGQMFVENPDAGRPIPFYKLDVEQSIRELPGLKPDGQVVVPAIGRNCFAVYYYGRAMARITPKGTLLFLEEEDPAALIPGCEYVVVCARMAALRIVRNDGEAGRVRLTAPSRDFDDIYLSISDIEKIYKVRGKLWVD